MGMQKFYANESFQFKNGAIGWRLTGPLDCLGPYAKVVHCPIEGRDFRRTCYATGHADSFFSIPAQCRIDGKIVKGFFTQTEGNIMFTPNSKPDPKLPLKGELYQLIRSVKQGISDEYRAFEEDEVPGIQLTVGCDPDTGNWSYQTGDNSYTGGAYSYRDWAVIGIYRNSNCRELADDILDQLAGLYWQ